MKYLAIGEICELLNGFAFKSKEYTNEGIRIIRIANVQKGYIEDSAPCYYPEVQLPTFKKSMLSTGDLLISLTGNVGRVGLLPESMIPAALNQRVGCLRVKNDHEMDIKYLFHLLNSDYFENACIESSNGAAQKNLSTNWLKEFLIPIPSLVEQKAIARVFEYIVLLLELEKRRVDYFDDLVKSRFMEMFGDPVEGCDWNRMRLDDLCSKLGSGATPRGGKAAYKNEGVPLIRSMNVYNGYFSWKELAYIDDNQAKKLNGVTLRKGDVLLNITGASVARSCVLPSELAGGRVNQHVAIIRADQEKILPVFLNAIFVSESYQHFLLNGSKMAGATREAITKQDLKEMTVPIPPLELQKKFVAFSRQVDKLKFETQQSIEKLQMLYDSLAQDYFAPEGD